jgi:sec-independent protein translocase protein TatB
MVNFSPEKLFLVGLIAVVVLGPHRLPAAARSLGRFVAEMRRMSSSLQSEVRDALAEPGDALTSVISDTGLADLRRSIHHGVTGLRDGITSGVSGEATGRSVPNPSLTAASTPAPDLGGPPAPEDPSFN